MRSVIPQYITLTAPLAEILEKVYAREGSLTKRAASKVILRTVGWGQEHSKAFKDLNQALQYAATLAHPDPRKLLCLFTEASDNHWSGVLTQVPLIELDLPFNEQHHEPLSFLPGSFKGSAARWSTPKKE